LQTETKLMKKYFFLLLLLPMFAFQTHKYYLSLTKVAYIKESKSVQVTARIFIDDLEAALDKKYNKSFELATKEELEDTDTFINKYVSSLLKITINNKLIPFKYLGKKYETDVIYIFVEIENIDAIKSIEIQNRILLDEFSEQQNIIKLNINDKKKSFILNNDSDKDLLKF